MAQSTKKAFWTIQLMKKKTVSKAGEGNIFYYL